MAIHPSRQAYVEEDGEDITYDMHNVPTALDDGNAASMGPDSQRASAYMAEVTRKKEAAAIAVPTDDGRVRARLRQMGEPMTVFGERPEDRRDRLRMLLYAHEKAGGELHPVDATLDEEAEDDDTQEFYTEGTAELADARRQIARYSLPRAQKRIQAQKLESEIPLQKHVTHRAHVRDHLLQFDNQGAQIAGERPVGMVRFAPDGKTIASGNWGGSIRLLNVPDLTDKALLRGHTSHVTGLSWFPGSTLPGTTVSEDAVNLASGGGEGKVHLWSLTQDTPIASLAGHSERVCRVEFHPSGKYLASASYDTTWRMWDVETTTELVLQEGHSRQCFAVAFNPEGSLLASAGLDSIASLWDLRVGRRVLYFDNHIAPIYGLSWGPDGHRLLTGSADGYAKCWDIRAQKEVASIGAHTGGVTDIRWFQGTDGPLSAFDNLDGSMDVDSDDNLPEPRKAGTFFVSCGFDKKVSIFSADDWSLCKRLQGHAGNVLSTDVTNDAKYIVSSGQDRTVNLWGRNDENLL